MGVATPFAPLFAQIDPRPNPGSRGLPIVN
jgi:hypothetical protein